jgi:hypothetical protein
MTRTGWAAHGGCLLLGAATALASLVDHRFATAGVPWGLALAVLASLGAVLWLRTSRRPTLAGTYAFGWLVLFGVVLLGRPEGDYLVAADLPGYTLMVVSVALVAVGVSGLAARRPAPGPPAA